MTIPTKEVKLELVRPGFYEALVDVAQTPTFPFFRVILEETNKAQSSDLKLLVSPTIRKHLMNIFGTDKLLFYIDVTTGRMEAWTADMLESTNMLSESNVMSQGDQWVLKARTYVNHVLTGTVGDRAEAYGGETALDFLRDILDAGGLLQKTDSDLKLLAIASDIVRSGRKDLDSCIYRLAMALFHSRNYSGRSAAPEIDDPGAAYLGIVGNATLEAKYPKLMESIRNWPAERRTDVMKTFICFCMASYLCYKAAPLREG